MAVKNDPALNVAFYVEVVRGESARDVAKKFGVSHPTALKYAAQGLQVLLTLPQLAAYPDLQAFLKTGDVRRQALIFDPAHTTALLELTQPMLDQAAEILATPAGERTVSLSARVPTSLFYQFKRLTDEIGQRRQDPHFNLSQHLCEVLGAYVASGVPPEAEAQFQLADQVMDDIRGVLAKHGLVKR